ncbi:MAG TPA: NADPH-dependent FMN reductase [Thermoanaerobaculia bacterium]|nr:NADPH-dependent FMN reductase [Thermoanaerobaculia bacterium]
MRIVGISGSLRAGSSNAALLRELNIEVWEGLGLLPHFNPDLDVADPPQTVREFRELLRSADGVIICSPEYAHGMPGSLKNALDWLVSDGTLVGKPVVVVTIAPTCGEHVHAQLVEVLRTMSWNVLTDASLMLRKGDDCEAALRASLQILLAAGGLTKAAAPQR